MELRHDMTREESIKRTIDNLKEQIKNLREPKDPLSFGWKRYVANINKRTLKIGKLQQELNLIKTTGEQ